VVNEKDTPSGAVRRKNRVMLIGIFAVFIGPMLVAAMLSWSGWRPAGSKAYGTLIDPPRDVSRAAVTLANGEKFVWRNPQWQWTLLALSGSTCAEQCRAALADVLRMRATLGRNATRLRVLYVGAPLPAEALAQLAPLQQGGDDAATFTPWRAQGDDTLALALVDPGGLLMMSYPQGFDVGGVRRDLPKVVQ